MWKRAIVFVLAACLLGGRAAESRNQTDDGRVALFERYAESLRRFTRVPGLSGIIVRDGATIWLKGLGFQDVEGRVPASPDTLYDVASLTKTFTSTLLLQCVERGTLSLATRISQYTAAIPEPDATVSQVLSHTSQAPSGTAYRYDGDRFAALTEVVAACQGRPFRQALADILDRAAMTSSVPGHDLEQPTATLAALFEPPTLSRYAAAIRRLATPYTTSGHSASRSDFPPRDINASAGLLSTVVDLARYDAAIDDNVFVSATTQAAAWTNARSTASGTVLAHGLGWFIQQIEGTRVIWHYGQWPQYSALYIKVPDEHLTLILLANSGGLGEAFPLAGGNVMVSPFARVFIGLFR